jgi:acyl-CoA thioesterase
MSDIDMTLHVFDEAIALQRQDDGHWRGHTSPQYANMVGPFGGVMAAQVMNAVLLHPDRLGDPVSLTVNFAAALADGPFVVQARPARTNRSTQHWIIEVVQGGQTALTATVFTALRRDTWNATDMLMPAVSGPAAFERPPGLGGRVAWLDRYELRFVQGYFPPVWDGTETDSLTRMWLRDDPPRPLDYASLTALSDVFYPRIWRRRASRVPIGTVSMTVYFHADAKQLQDTGTGYLLGQALAQAFRNGYFDQTAQLWNEAGELLVTTHQVVYYKE